MTKFQKNIIARFQTFDLFLLDVKNYIPEHLCCCGTDDEGYLLIEGDLSEEEAVVIADRYGLAIKGIRQI